jgi:hypothetical protein
MTNKEEQNRTTPYGEVKSQELADVLIETDQLSYAHRLKSLQADENNGEAALIVDPVESQTWFVELPEAFLVENGARSINRARLASFIIEWTAQDAGQPGGGRPNPPQLEALPSN